MEEEDIETGKFIAIISYLSIIGTIVAYFMNQNKKSTFAGFHLRQSLGLWLTFAALGLVTSQFDSWFATLGFYLFFGVLFIFGFANAVAGRAQAVPLLGELYQKWFTSFGN